MSTETSKELVRRFFDERWNHGNLDVYDEMAAPGFDVERHKAWMRSMYAVFGREMTILSLVAEGDQVAVHWRFSGVYQGDYLGVAATGKQMTYQGIALLRIVDDKIVDDIAYWGIMGRSLHQHSNSEAATGRD